MWNSSKTVGCWPQNATRIWCGAFSDRAVYFCYCLFGASQTFDGRYWHFYDGNRRNPTRVTMYKSTTRDFVVQAQVVGNPAVACALAGREGKDRVMINACNGNVALEADFHSQKVEDQPRIDVSGNTCKCTRCCWAGPCQGAPVLPLPYLRHSRPTLFFLTRCNLRPVFALYRHGLLQIRCLDAHSGARPLHELVRRKC